MSIERHGHKIETICNGCNTPHKVYDSDDFQIMISDLKADGWRIQKNRESGEWEHYCPTC